MSSAIKQLINKFNQIKKMGYIEGINNRYDGIGYTFENLLGKEPDNFPFPDYNMIEIKTIRSYTKSSLHLFSLAPEGKDFFESKRLYDTYGHNGKANNNEKVLNNDVICNKLTKIGIDNYFSLKVDYIEKKVKLLIYNRNKKIIDDYSYWTFESLELALNRKLKKLAIIEAWDKIVNNQKYYKYCNLSIYKLRGFNEFIKCIEQGKIIITLNYGTYKKGKKKGEMHNHGTIFSIKKEYVKYIFRRIY